jgi:TonB family protein
METRQRIQTEARRDDEEVMTMSRSRLVLTGVLAASCLPFLTSALAQGTPAPLIIDNPKDFHRYALYCPKPEYPINLRDRRVAGSGKFLLHIRPDGTVQSVETLSSTGHAELDDFTKSSFIKWRFRPGPTAAKIPITFKAPRGTPGWPFGR